MASQSPRRVALFGPMVALLGIVGCGSGGNGLGGPAGGGGRGGTTVVYPNQSRNLDVLFVVDKTAGIEPDQSNLIANFPSFLATLAAQPGGMPNLHVGVVSSNLGAGNLGGGCIGNGDQGLLQATPRGACTDSTLKNGATFISNVDGVANYTAPIEEVFGCIAKLGAAGCSFPQPLLAAVYALGADNFDPNTGRPQPPAQNRGFLRDDAHLAIIMLSQHDDCSAPGGAASDLFSWSRETDNLASPLGPVTQFRCNEVGHLCGSPLAPPPRLSPIANDPGDYSTVVTLEGCVSNEDGRLIPLPVFTQVIKALKPDPDRQVLVAGITGVYPEGGGYQINWRPALAPDSGPWPEIIPACVGQAGAHADPAVRVTEWVKQFGRNGLLQSFCDDSYGPGLRRVADELGRLMPLAGPRPQCATGVIARDPTSGAYDCTVTDQVAGENQPIPSCAASGDAHPCWHLDATADCWFAVDYRIPAGTVSLLLTVDRDGATPAGLTSTTLSCR